MANQVENPEARPRQELADFFEKFGYVVLNSLEEFQTFNRYVSQKKIPTWTSTDSDTGLVTFHKRLMGEIEGFGFMW